MILIGDVHGNWEEYREICKSCKESLQLGDFGLGFHGHEDPHPDTLADTSKHRFLRGNHDNPAVCRARPGCLSDWGYNEEMDLFWLSGGFSIDFDYRTEGLDWWEGEELSYQVLSQEVIPAFLKAKPRFVVSHECPVEAQFDMFPHTKKRLIQNRTKMAMQSMWDSHKPEFWVFGHYHERRLRAIGGTQFVCCSNVLHGRPLKLQLDFVTFEIPGLNW